MATGSFFVKTEAGQRRSIVIREMMATRPLTQTLARAGWVLNTRCGERGLCRGCEVVTSGGVTLKACQTQAIEVNALSLLLPQKSLLTGALSIVAEFQPRCEFSIAPPFNRRSGKDLGIAVDIGTTSVVVAIVGIEDGKLLASESAINAQVDMGDDVMTRIGKCSESPAGLAALRERLFVRTLAPLLTRLQERLQFDPVDIIGAVVAANTAMLHIFAGQDPSGMGRYPFTPRFLGPKCIDNRLLPWISDSWKCKAMFDWLLLPGYSAFIGADIAAGWLASGMIDQLGPTLLLDLGTNGEMILQSEGKVIGCATAAGPAFEGANLSFGVRAVPGAISRIRGHILRKGSFTCEHIGQALDPAIGICGSAYVDFLAIGCKTGLLSSSGRFNPDSAKALGIQLIESASGWIWPIDPDQPDGPSISEYDVTLLLQAKAAIAAGTQILLEESGLRPEDMAKVYLAGGFGLNLGLQSAIDSGILPGFQRTQIEVIGNAALGGAFIALLDASRADELNRATQSIRVIELNLHPHFQDAFLDHLSLA